MYIYTCTYIYVHTQNRLWDREAMNCGTVPSQSVKFQLNEHLTFEFIDRQHISLEYSCDNIKHKFNLGAREKRLAPNYLLNATRKFDGRYEPKIDHVTLKMRQAELYEHFQAQRNKIHPKSENLSEMVSDIVMELKLHFDEISMKLKSVSGMYICIYIYTYVYINVYVHIYIFIYICIYM
jgi:hypothetical protein